MPRANRYILAGNACHLTHRCHDGSFLFRFARDRTEYRNRLRASAKHFKLSVLTYCITSNHVHLLVEPLPHTTPSRLVNSLKGVSSRFLRQEFPELEKHYWKGGLWSPSYFIASCGGAPLDVVKVYIEKQ